MQLHVTPNKNIAVSEVVQSSFGQVSNINF